MARTSDPQEPRPRHLRLLEPLQPHQAALPLPVAVPVLRPDQAVTPNQDALLTGLARQARRGDEAALDLLRRAFAPLLEPVVLRCGRMTWGADWAQRDDRPWELEDLRQETWLVFTDVVKEWNGEGSFTPYVTAFFAWRLRNAMHRLGPQRRSVMVRPVRDPVAECQGLLDAESADLLQAVVAALTPVDAEILRLRIGEGSGFHDIACRLALSRRTVGRRWRRIGIVARTVLSDAPRPGAE